MDLRHSPAWRDWRALAGDAAPFLSPDFFALDRALAPPGEALVALARRGLRIDAALPLRLDREGTLHALRSEHSPAFDLVGDPDAVDELWSTLRADERWSELELEGVPATSSLATRLPTLARRDGCPAVVRPGARHRRFGLPGFVAAMNPKFRTNLQRCERKAGGVTFERLAPPRRRDVDEALAIEAMAWKGAAGTDIAATPAVDHLYRTVARLFGRRGQASLCFLRIGERRVATLFAVEDADTLYALKIGYDPRCAALSPGHLLVWHAAADAERRRLRWLDFVGNDSEWKQKWSDETRDHVVVTVYRRSARGLARYLVRDVIKPQLRARLEAHDPGGMRTLRSPLRRGCQRADLIGAHGLGDRVVGRLHEGLGVRSGIKRALAPRPPKPPTPLKPPLGEPSRFAAGSWVRVRDEAAIRATLDEGARLRGLVFVPAQWQTCGRVLQVQKVMRRIRDDRGQMRPVARTVLLADASCAGDGPEPAGCGRRCPLMYRDEWLEPAEAPPRVPPAPSRAQHARVRSLDEIAAGLDLYGRRDALTFMPEMAQYAGRRFAIAQQLTAVYEYDHWVAPPHPIYILAGLHCSGAVLGDAGPCDRACALLWHADWLLVEAADRPTAVEAAR